MSEVLISGFLWKRTHRQFFSLGLGHLFTLSISFEGTVVCYFDLYRIQEDESVDNEDGEDPYMGIIGDDADPPLFLKPLPQVQQVQEEEDTPKQSAASASSRKDTKQSDPRRSSSLPSCSAPTPNRYVSATDAPGYVFPGKRPSSIDIHIFILQK